MILQRVETRAYRNLADACVELNAGVNVLAGENAQGKTNFLEAVHLLCCQRSFRGARAAEMVAFGCESSIVRGVAVVRDVQREVVVALTRGGRRVMVDGKAARGSAEKLRGLAAVLFRSEDLSVARGSPSARRALLDGAIAVVWPQYRQVYRQYAKVLQTRNRVLRSRPREMDGLLDVYDRQLSEAGAKVTVTRLRYLRVIVPTFAEVFRFIVDDDRADTFMRYVAPEEISEAGERIDDVAHALEDLLRKSRGRDRMRGSTEHGPHAHDVVFSLGGRPARNFGSQGQLRALVLAFRIAQTQDALAKLGHCPVLLLDDVSSELDERRNKKLFDFVFGVTCQVLVTTARPDLLPTVGKAKTFKVVDGVIYG